MLTLAWAAGQYDLDYLVTRDDLERMMREPERYRAKTWMVFPLLWLPADAVDQAPPTELLAFRGDGPIAPRTTTSSTFRTEPIW